MKNIPLPRNTKKSDDLPLYKFTLEALYKEMGGRKLDCIEDQTMSQTFEG